MIPAHAATQNVRRSRRCGGRTAGWEPGADARRTLLRQRGRARRGRRPVPLVGYGGEVDRQNESRDHEDGQDAAEVVHRFGRLVGVRGDEHQRHDQRDHGEGQGDQEHRPPVEVFEQRARDHRPEHGDASAEGRPQCDRLRPRPRPQGGDQRQGGRVGHAGRESPDDPGHHEDGVIGRVRGEQAGGDGEGDAEEQQQLAPVTVADRTQIEHRCGQAEGVPHGDQVQCGLGRVEGLPDRGQGHVGHRQVQVGHRRNDDQGRQDERRARRCLVRHLGSRRVTSRHGNLRADVSFS